MGTGTPFPTARYFALCVIPGKSNVADSPIAVQKSAQPRRSAFSPSVAVQIGAVTGNRSDLFSISTLPSLFPN
jgi:hypothetical protein